MHPGPPSSCEVRAIGAGMVGPAAARELPDQVPNSVPERDTEGREQVAVGTDPVGVEVDDPNPLLQPSPAVHRSALGGGRDPR